MIVGVADTHTVVWYLYADKRLSATAQAFITNTLSSGDEIDISSITLVELVHPIERQRIAVETLTTLASEQDSAHSVFAEIPLNLSIIRTLTRVDRNQIPELPDRIIAASALHLNIPVIRRDHKIQSSAIQTIW